MGFEVIGVQKVKLFPIRDKLIDTEDIINGYLERHKSQKIVLISDLGQKALIFVFEDSEVSR